jgi:hypothetical protein
MMILPQNQASVLRKVTEKYGRNGREVERRFAGWWGGFCGWETQAETEFWGTEIGGFTLGVFEEFSSRVFQVGNATETCTCESP